MQFWGEGAGTRSGAWKALQHPAGLPLGRRLAGYFLAVVLAPLLTIVLASLRGQLTLSTDALAFLAAVIAVVLAGSLVPAVLEVVAGLTMTISLPAVAQATTGHLRCALADTSAVLPA
jgi:hypothetical protein